MRSKTLKWIILVFTLICALIVVAQLFWLNKVYNFEQKEFNASVMKCMHVVFEDMSLKKNTSKQLAPLTIAPDPNTYIFKIDYTPSFDSLSNLIAQNLEDFGLFAACSIGLYDHTKNEYSGQTYIAGILDNEKLPDMKSPVFQEKYSFVQLYFPHRNKYVLNSLSWWILGSVILITVLVILGISIFQLYKQKFLNEIQNDFIRNVTHEFQTPLTTLTVGLDILAKPGTVNQPEKMSKYVQLMQGQTNYLKQHVENMVQVMRAESTGIPAQRTTLSPNDLIRTAVAQLYVSIEEKKAVIDLELEKNDQHIIGDKNNLYIVVLNLLSNAIKYSTDPIIAIKSWRDEEHFFISVADNGLGIADGEHKKLFKKFYRVSNGDVHDVRGLGLGLYFVKKTIAQHHGKLSLESALGKGSTFTIKLPINYKIK